MVVCTLSPLLLPVVETYPFLELQQYHNELLWVATKNVFVATNLVYVIGRHFGHQDFYFPTLTAYMYDYV